MRHLPPIYSRRRAIRLLGREDSGQSDKVLRRCNHNSGMAWQAGSLNAFRPRARRRRPRGDVLVSFLRRAPVDFDRTFEVRAFNDGSAIASSGSTARLTYALLGIVPKIAARTSLLPRLGRTTGPGSGTGASW
jgi:hypothetical protein